jgi:hypothetical protein
MHAGIVTQPPLWRQLKKVKNKLSTYQKQNFTTCSANSLSMSVKQMATNTNRLHCQVSREVYNDRYLTENNIQTNILKDIEFEKSRQVLAAKRKNLVEQGNGCKPQATRALTYDEENTLFITSQFGDSSPRAFQRTMWWFLSMHFGFRARDESRKLRWGDVELRAVASMYSWGGVGQTQKNSEYFMAYEATKVFAIRKMKMQFTNKNTSLLLLGAGNEGRRPEEIFKFRFSEMPFPGLWGSFDRILMVRKQSFSMIFGMLL